MEGASKLQPVNHLTELFTESVIRMMSRVCLQHGGINLAQGYPDWDAPEELKEAAVKAIRDGKNQYAITFGQPALREAIARRTLAYNHYEVDPDREVTVVCGSTEGMIASLRALINQGDEVVIFEPFYENYGPDTLLSEATPRYVTLYPPDWHFDPAELAAAFGPKTKALVMNSPNNPTGKVFSREELAQIAEQCIKWDAYAVCDDIYEHILFDGAEHLALATLPGMRERTLTINSISKTYSATGWRIGWVIAPPAVTSAVRKVHDFLTVGAPAPLQEAVVAAMELPESYYRELRELYAACRGTLYAALDELGFHPSLPRGAYYIITEPAEIMARLKARDDFELAIRLIETTGVASVPGSSFFSRPELGKSQVRFCFCKQAATLERAVTGLARLRRLG